LYSPSLSPSPVSSLAFGSCLGSGPLCRLHSFPTRRSSDLERGRCGSDHFLKRIILLTGNFLKLCGYLCIRRYFRKVFYSKQFLRDRKSTRLNSSHVSSSYAVFCLKKKTRIDAYALRPTDRS